MRGQWPRARRIESGDFRAHSLQPQGPPRGAGLPTPTPTAQTHDLQRSRGSLKPAGLAAEEKVAGRQSRSALRPGECCHPRHCWAGREAAPASLEPQAPQHMGRQHLGPKASRDPPHHNLRHTGFESPQQAGGCQVPSWAQRSRRDRRTPARRAAPEDWDCHTSGGHPLPAAVAGEAAAAGADLQGVGERCSPNPPSCPEEH